MHKLSRRHYEFMAESLRYDKSLNKDQKQMMANVMGKWFRVVANFNAPLWYKACGVKEEERVNDTGHSTKVPSTGRNQTTTS